ncbi:protein ACCELERATED CELL DEATH 6-like [Carex rostrata]
MENNILHILSANGHPNLLSEICRRDSSLLKAHNVKNETPFHHAARFGRIETISELIRCAKDTFSGAEIKELLRQKNNLGETALHEATRHGHVPIVSILMDEDFALAGLVNCDSVSALYLATARESLEMVHNMVAKLSNHAITPEFYSGPRNQTALHAAGVLIELLCVILLTELTEELLKLYSESLHKGTDETGRTPLHLVALTGNHKIAKLLLDRDPSLAYIQDSERSYPIHTAVRMGHIKIIVLLLQRCLDSGELLDSNGRNFLHIAVEANKSNLIFKFLKDSKKKLPTSYWKKIFNNMANTMDHEGNTPLHLAAKHGYDGVMLSLLENNQLDLTLQNKESLTAFDLSVIQFRKSARNTQVFFWQLQRRDDLGEFYVQKRGARFSKGWFQYYTEDRETLVSPMRINSSGGKAQLVGLGSVLIATVTFAAAFTLPGGTNQDTGTPILGKKNYMFKTFIFADFFAFGFSFLATILLIYSTRVHNDEIIEKYTDMSMDFFTVAAQCMVIALGLGLDLVLSPIGKIGLLVLTLTVSITLLSNLTLLALQFMRFRVQ